MVATHSQPQLTPAPPPNSPHPVAPPVNLDAIPQALRNLRQWVTWRYEWRADKQGGGKWTKVPYSPFVADLTAWPHHSRAKADTLATWSTFDAVVHAYQTEQTYNAADGIGFVFAAGGGLFGADFDNCLDAAGQVEPWARNLILLLGPTYTEMSPSGRGLKMFGRGTKPGPHCKAIGLGPHEKGVIELYDRDRFFTVTGLAWTGFASLSGKEVAL